MILADIGNSRAHILNGDSIIHCSIDDAIKNYEHQHLYYICVNQSAKDSLKGIANWEDISSSIHIEGEYSSMGVDRKALCLSRNNGVFVDAGSAITVDLVQNGIYEGGFILLGLNSFKEAYKKISKTLDVQLDISSLSSKLPKTTKESISYGIIAPIKAIIEKHSTGLPLYFTGGDGAWLSSFFDGSTYDEGLVFEGIKKALKGKVC